MGVCVVCVAGEGRAAAAHGGHRWRRWAGHAHCSTNRRPLHGTDRRAVVKRTHRAHSSANGTDLGAIDRGLGSVRSWVRWARICGRELLLH